MKSILQSVVLFFFSIFAGLLMCEIGLRIWGFAPGNPYERLVNHYDGYLGYRMIPGMHEDIQGPGGHFSVDIVSLGFKDGAGFRDDGATKPVYSIFIGDSFIWGSSVNLADCVSEQFERLTGKDSVNMGMTHGTSPTQYSRIFAKYGTELEPQHAFIGFFVGNEYGDAIRFSNWELSRSTKSYPEWYTIQSQDYSPNEVSLTIRKLIYKNSSLGRLLLDRINFGFKTPALENDDNILHLKTGDIDFDLDKSQLLTQLNEPSSQQIGLVRTALNEMKRTGNARSIKIVVFIIPTKEMVYQSFIPDPKLKAGVDPRYVSVLGILKDLEITYIDLSPIFREAASHGEGLYFKTDGHWNAKGHLLAAKTIRDFLAGNNNK